MNLRHVYIILFKKIKKAGRKAGVVLNHGTPESLSSVFIDDIDYILLMTINQAT